MVASGIWPFCDVRLGSTCSPDAWDVDDAYSPWSLLDAGDQGAYHLFQGDKPKAPSSFPCRWQQPTQGISGKETVGPAMAGAEYVPGAKDGGGNPAGTDARLSSLAHGNISPHDWSGLGHADVDKMSDASRECRCQRGVERGQVHVPEACGFGRAGMRCANEMDECVGGRDGAGEGGWIKSVPDDDRGAGRNTLRAGFPDERPNAVATRQQCRNQGTTHVSRGTGNENAVMGHWLRSPFLCKELRAVELARLVWVPRCTPVLRPPAFRACSVAIAKSQVAFPVRRRGRWVS